MKILINERLSEHRCKTPEGYLICTDAILARTGKQTYRKNEIFKDSDDETEIEVDRTEDEVFSPQTLASFENKPVTVEHPDEDVNVHNYKEYAVGFVRDVHRGVVNGQPVILGNLVITDEKAIQEIENGEHTDLSCGYDCDIVDEPNPCQRNIRGNHVALCECGRAGIARIVDSKVDDAKLKLPIGYIETTNSMGFHYIRRADHARLMPAEVLKIEEALRAAEISAEQVEYDISDRWIGYRTSGRLSSHGYIDSKCKDFDDTGKNIRVVKEFIEQNGNKFDKRKDADAILEYIKKRTGIANADYGDVLYIIKEYTRADITDSVKDANHLPAKVKRDLQKFLNHKSTFIRNKDYDIAEFVKEFERVSRLWVEFPLKIVRESIKGWFKTGDGMMRKDYEFSIEGYDDRFMVSLYAKPDTYETTELNAYFTDSVEDATQRRTTDSMKDTREIKAWALYKGQTIIDESPVYDAWDINDDVYVNVGDGIYHHAKLISKEGNGAFNACVVKDLVTGKTIKTVMNRLRLFTKDPTHDALIPPTKESINMFESLLRTSNIKIDRKGFTTFGRVHYQVHAFMPFDQFVKLLHRIDDEMGKLGIPMTFNAGADGDGDVCTAGIDLDKQYVKDSQRAQKFRNH